MNHPTLSKERIAQLMASLKKPPAIVTAPTTGIQYNEAQQRFIDIASSGKSCVLTGPAGTGKSTSQKGAILSLIQSGKAGVLSSQGHKHLKDGTPGIVICAYTRRAVTNIRKMLPADLQDNCITIHKLLEYQPFYEDVYDEVSGTYKTKMFFAPNRTPLNPLPPSITTIIFEESSMIGTDLYKMVVSALAHKVQFIFLGDIQQLPPVFGPAVLGFKLTQLPSIELTHVYRQALESPIIKLAHRILSGKSIPLEEYPDWHFPNQLKLHPWKKKLDPIHACNVAGAFFTQAHSQGLYDPEQDIILIPFNKAFGTDELNKLIANHLAKKASRPVFQVISGFNRLHFSVGDKVLYEKEDAVIKGIYANPSYSGSLPKKASLTLDYWGHESSEAESTDEDVDFMLSQVAKLEGEDSRVRVASHTIVLEMLESGTEVKLSNASELNALSLGYCLTVHKAQGSEWRKVYLCFHHSHATMLQRELLYTAVTRAKQELYVICEPDTFTKGITGQRIKGNTMAEKAEVFKGKLTEGEDYTWIGNESIL